MVREHRFANIPKPQSSICTAARFGLPIESWWACWSPWNVPRQGRREKVFVCRVWDPPPGVVGHEIAVQLIKPQNLWGVSNPPRIGKRSPRPWCRGGPLRLNARDGSRFPFCLARPPTRRQQPPLHLSMNAPDGSRFPYSPAPHQLLPRLPLRRLLMNAPGVSRLPYSPAPHQLLRGTPWAPPNERTGRFQVPVFPGATPTPPAAPPAAPLNERTGRFQAPVFPGATPTPPAAPPAAPLNERTGRFQVPVFPGAAANPQATAPAAPLNERTGRFQVPVLPGATPSPPVASPAAPLNERTGRFPVPVFPGATQSPPAPALPTPVAGPTIEQRLAELERRSTQLVESVLIFCAGRRRNIPAIAWRNSASRWTPLFRMPRLGCGRAATGRMKIRRVIDWLADRSDGTDGIARRRK